MEFASHSTNNSHNITGMACKLAKAFKLKSLGVFLSHNHTTNNSSATLSRSIDDGCSRVSNEFCTEKVYPQPQEVRTDHRNNMAFDIEDVFEAISALKLAYVRLQNAHLNFDPLKIKAADECIAMHLDKLSQMKRCFNKLREIKKVDLKVLDDLESEINGRECQIVRLKREVEDLSLNNAKMIEKYLGEGNKIWSNGVSLFEDVYGGVSYAIRDFTKLLIMLMRDSGLDLDCATEFVEKSVVYSKRSHKKYAFQAFVARRMFHDGFSTHTNDSFDHNLVRFEDPISALIEDPTSSFADFCISKYLLVIHPKLEALMFGNLDHRDMISKGKHPRTAFYQAFVKMARWVSLLRGISGLVKSKPQMFAVQRGTKFTGAYMESIDVKTSIGLGSCHQLQVELMVMPGFRIGNALVKCKVYASTIKH